MRILAQLSSWCFSIQPNQDALNNTVVSASLVHLEDAPHVGKDSMVSRGDSPDLWTTLIGLKGERSGHAENSCVCDKYFFLESF